MPECTTSTPSADEPVDHLADVGLVARDRVRAHDHDVAGADLDPPVLVGGHQRQRRHRLALGAGADDAHLGRVEVADRRRCRRSRLSGMCEQAHRRGPARTFFFIDMPIVAIVRLVADGGVGDLLHAVDVAGEAGRDDALAHVRGEQVAQHAAHRRLRARVALLVGVGRVGQQQPDALLVAERADAGQVGEPTVDGRQVELEVTGVQDDPLGRVEGGGEAVGHRVGDGDELARRTARSCAARRR